MYFSFQKGGRALTENIFFKYKPKQGPQLRSYLSTDYRSAFLVLGKYCCCGNAFCTYLRTCQYSREMLDSAWGGQGIFWEAEGRKMKHLSCWLTLSSSSLACYEVVFPARPFWVALSWWMNWASSDVRWTQFCSFIYTSHSEKYNNLINNKALAWLDSLPWDL